MSESPKKIAEKVGVYAPFGQVIINTLNLGSPEKRELRDREKLIKQVKAEVTGLLKSVLHNSFFLNSSKILQPDQVNQQWLAEAKVNTQGSQNLPRDTKIVDLFDKPQVLGKFLLLGDPGVGKSTELLRLADELIQRAEFSNKEPIPVILNLSSWDNSLKDFSQWLTLELKNKYGIGKQLCKRWIADSELILLLDGLDELETQKQNECIHSLNEFMNSDVKPQHVVVCSRSEEYEASDVKLQLNAAIYIQSLSRNQVKEFLCGTGHSLAWDVMEQQEELLLEINKPLFLSIVVLVFSNDKDFLARYDKTSSEPLHEYLFQAYIDVMNRRQLKNTWYPFRRVPSTQSSMQWLTHLATAMTTNSESEFVIEKVEETFQRKAPEGRILYVVVTILLFSAVGFASSSLDFGNEFKVYTYSTFAATTTLVLGLFLVDVYHMPKVYRFALRHNPWINLSKSSFDKLFAFGIIVIHILNILVAIKIFQSPLIGGFIFPSPDFYSRAYNFSVLMYKPFIGMVGGFFGGIIFLILSQFLPKSNETLVPSISNVSLGLVAGLMIGSLIIICEYFEALLNSIIQSFFQFKFILSPILFNLLPFKIITFFVFLTIFTGITLSISDSHRNIKNRESPKNLITFLSGFFFILIPLLISYGVIIGSFISVVLFLLIVTVKALFNLPSSPTEFLSSYLGAMEIMPARDMSMREFYYILVFLSFGGMLSGILSGFWGAEIKWSDRTRPNQGIWSSIKNAFIFSCVGVLVCTPLFLFIDGFERAISNILFITFIFFMVASKTWMTHFFTRIVLFFKGYIPWDYARFLNYSTERMFLQRVGGRYRFIHRLLKEHLGR